MKTTWIFTSALALALLTPTSGIAEQTHRRFHKRSLDFSQLDSDGDGSVSEYEFIEGRKKRMREHFRRLDADGDGVVTEREVQLAKERRRQRQQRYRDDKRPQN